MNDQTDSNGMASVINSMRSAAAARGIAPPVLCFLDLSLPPARAIVADPDAGLRPKASRDPCIGITVAEQQAARLLRRHAGAGGAALAEVLEGGTAVDFWQLIPRADEVRLGGCAEGVNAINFVVPYDRGVRLPRLVLRSDGPSVVPVQMRKGNFVQVCGPTSSVAMQAAGLVCTVLQGDVCYLNEEHYECCRLDDDALAAFLQQQFADTPCPVAEAIRAFEKMETSPGRQLKRVLWGRPELRRLARKVQAELAVATA